MIVVCKCGERRTASPWKSSREVKVNACLVCVPGRLDRFQYRPVKEISTVERMRLARARSPIGRRQEP